MYGSELGDAGHLGQFCCSPPRQQGGFTGPLSRAAARATLLIEVADVLPDVPECVEGFHHGFVRVEDEEDARSEVLSVDLAPGDVEGVVTI